MKSHTNSRLKTESHFFDLSVPERDCHDPGRVALATPITR